MIKNWIIKQVLDSKGPGFCLEKWGTSTIHLATGQEHGCHHCGPRYIDPAELKTPSSLFNHMHKQIVRKEMLEGKIPEECSYCHSSVGVQDRIIQSGYTYNWFNPNINKLTSDPRNLEVSFSNVCNMACSYCGPTFSSKWMGEIESKGEYPNAYNRIHIRSIPEKDNNPYINAFWEYWPTVKKQLKQLRITGGEPLLSKHTYLLLEESKGISTTINSNLSVEDRFIDQLIDNIKYRNDIVIATSGESTGCKAEYSRHGLDYNKFLSNLQKIKDQCPRVKLHVMATYNVFCVSTFTDFLRDIKNIDKNISLHVSRLTQPRFLTHRLILDYKQESMQYISKNFRKETKQRFENILLDNEYINLEETKNQFKQFIEEFDKRRGLDFSKTFPEYDYLIR
jgi:organic radical activating enzyme